MGHMGNRGRGDMGYKGYGPHGQCGTWAIGYGVQGYEPHGQLGTWAMRPMGNLHPKCQKDVKLSKRCQMSKNETPRLWRRFTKKLN